MNASAEKHLAKAKDYLAKGDEFYRKAKPEIDAAYAAGVTQIEIARYLARGRTWVQDVLAWDGTGTLYGKDTERRQRDQVKQSLRAANPDEIADQFLADPEIRDKVGRALDRHYTEATRASRQRQHDRDVEEHGGEAEHAAFRRRQRIAEVVNVARGLTTGMRFVVEEVKRLDLDEFEEMGVIDQLVTCAEEVEGFAVLLRQFLAGTEITDDDLAAFIGGGS